jgi:hypothetical protein
MANTVNLNQGGDPTELLALNFMKAAGGIPLFSAKAWHGKTDKVPDLCPVGTCWKEPFFRSTSTGSYWFW